MFGSERTRTIRTESMFDRGRTTSVRARTVQNFLTNSVRGRTTTFRKGFKKNTEGRKRAEPMILLSVIALHISDQHWLASSHFSQNIEFTFSKKDCLTLDRSDSIISVYGSNRSRKFPNCPDQNGSNSVFKKSSRVRSNPNTGCSHVSRGLHPRCRACNRNPWTLALKRVQAWIWGGRAKGFLPPTPNRT